MKIIRIILRAVWRAWFLFSAFLIFLPLYPVFLILLSKEEWFPYAFKLKKFWAKLNLFNSGIRYQINSKTVLDKNQAYVFCPNHSSILDIVISYVCIPNYFHFMGKAELQDVPMLNIFFKKMNIAVDRKSVSASHRAYNRAKRDLKKNISIGIFPEATIPACAPRLGSVKNGAFKLALEMQVPIIPVTYVNTWKIMPDGIKGEKYGGQPGKIFIYIHEPVETKGMTDADIKFLKETVMQKIGSALPEEFRNIN